jgi:hypothetical protein
MVMHYLASVIVQFDYYKSLGEKTFAQISEEQMRFQVNAESNSIAMIVFHLYGNMLSRWTDFLSTDGEKEWRKRDDEFEVHSFSKNEIMQQWNAGWDCLFSALNSLTEADFEKPVYIRKQEHSVIEAINRQLAHYAYHVGQIVFLGKMLRHDHWHSLSIPKGESAQFNAQISKT